MFFSGFSYHQQPGSPGDASAAPSDDRDHNLTVLLTFGIFFSFILLYLVAGVIWASVVTACAVALSFCYLKTRQRAALRHRAAMRAARSRGGTEAAVVLSVIPAFAYKREGGIGGGGDATGWAQCVICLGLVQVGEVVRRLPVCKHLFHVECIDMWLRSHSTCPICRAAVQPNAAGQPEPPPV